MKTPEEWFEEELSGEPLTQESVIEVLEMVQKDAWNEAIDKAAENTEVKAYYKYRHKGSRYKEWKEGDDINLFETTQMYKVDKNSILKLKI